MRSGLLGFISANFQASLWALKSIPSSKRIPLAAKGMLLNSAIHVASAKLSFLDNLEVEFEWRPPTSNSDVRLCSVELCETLKVLESKKLEWAFKDLSTAWTAKMFLASIEALLALNGRLASSKMRETILT